MQSLTKPDSPQVLADLQAENRRLHRIIQFKDGHVMLDEAVTEGRLIRNAAAGVDLPPRFNWRRRPQR